MAKSVSRGASVACWSASSKAAVVFGPLETHDRSDIDIGDSVELIFYTKEQYEKWNSLVLMYLYYVLHLRI